MGGDQQGQRLDAQHEGPPSGARDSQGRARCHRCPHAASGVFQDGPQHDDNRFECVSPRHQQCCDPQIEQNFQILLCDIRRTHFNAKTSDDDPVYFKLTAGADAPPGMCALLCKHMYGTRRAAEGWKDECSTRLLEAGFVQGMASSCALNHPERGESLSVRGDEFTGLVSEPQPGCFEKTLRARYELTVGARLGPGPKDDKEGTVLNHVISWTSTGVEYEADPRQVELLAEELGLEGEGVKGVVTTGVKILEHQAQTQKVLPENEHTRFQRLAAPAKLPCSRYSRHPRFSEGYMQLNGQPERASHASLQAAGQASASKSSDGFLIPFQSASTSEVYADTERAGYVRTRKSSAGGRLTIVPYVTECWSATQVRIALNSVEA